MMKKVYLLLVLALSMFCFSCKRNVQPTEELYPAGQLPTTVEYFDSICGVQSLWCFVIDDYDFNEMAKTSMGDDYVAAGACSEVRRGDFVTRNLDWFQYDQATYVVALKHSDAHQASLTVCGLNDNIKHDFNNKNLTPEEANLLLANGLDGMNESGVYIGVNVVPFRQMSVKGEEGKIDYHPTTGENMNKAQLSTGLLLRLVLDHATDLKSAEELIKGTPWKDTKMLCEGGFQAHWLVATQEGSFVCEFIDGEPTFTYAASTDTADYGNIMTNFSNYLMANGGNIQSHGSGFERYNLLATNYKTATPFEFARLVFYSKMYNQAYTEPDYLWTEWASDQFPAQMLMTWRDNAEARVGDKWNEFVESYNDAVAKYDWRQLGYDLDHSRGSWYTAHSSVWNLATKTLVLDIEEQNRFAVKMNLDGSFEPAPQEE